ncbi:MAG: GNAT family N-acetyltransferase, partial [Eubacteriales bacterium]
DFKKLLPKLYNPECDPCHANYVVTENGRLKAAIGAFDSVLSVGGEELCCRGIGNVAVHPYARSKGYMIDCMNMALSDMVRDGVDFSILGGQRQRYGYFGFDAIGPEYHASINATNLRHVFRNVPFTELEILDVTADDADLLDQMYALHNTRPEHTVRPREKFFDIARSWCTTVHAVRKDGAFIGYFVGGLKELTLADPADFNDVVRNYVRSYGSVDMSIPAWDTVTLEAAMKICEHTELGTCDMFNIFNYEKVVGALLRLKTTVEELADGVLTLYIHGYAGDCRLRLTVKGNAASVEPCDGPCDLELSHMEAMQLFCGLHSPYTRRLSPAIRSWFPLPLYVESADHV